MAVSVGAATGELGGVGGGEVLREQLQEAQRGPDPRGSLTPALTPAPEGVGSWLLCEHECLVLLQAPRGGGHTVLGATGGAGRAA